MLPSATSHSSILLRLACYLALGICGSACEPLADEGRLPPPISPPFFVAALRPAVGTTEVPRTSDVVLTFSDLPAPETLTYPSLSLGARGDPARVTIEISLVDRQVRLRPVGPLPAKTEIVLSLSRSVQSLAGRPLPSSFQAVFRTSEAILPPPPVSPAPTLGLLFGPSGELTTSCAQAGCHRRQVGTGEAGQEPASGLDLSLPAEALRPSLLSGRRGGTEGLLWVEPGRPESSYLLRKLLAAQPGTFARITGSAMPLAGPPLSADTLRKMESWIRLGAQ